MPSPFATAIAASFATLQSAAGQSVTYRRGASSVGVTAVPGRSEFELDQGDGSLVTNSQTRDYLVAVADLVIDDTAIEPQPGDQVVEGGQVYEVMHPSGDTPWRYSDSGQTRYRIFTRHVGADS